ncbi:MAG: DUF4468 domain-containing protein [Bacteroidales bacterium]|nr:DUF4468 domain-containing protein [Bacteroidales bacterium]
MKIIVLNIIASILMLGSLSVNAQNSEVKMPVDPETKLITYKEVVTVAGTPSELFNRAIEWINKQYKNPADATKVRDQASGIIEIVHRIELSKIEKGATLVAGRVDYSMKIELKDGRFRYTITNFNMKEISRQPFERYMNKLDKSYIPAWDDYLKQVDDFTRKLIESLKQGMQAPAPKKPDTW